MCFLYPLTGLCGRGNRLLPPLPYHPPLFLAYACKAGWKAEMMALKHKDTLISLGVPDKATHALSPSLLW